MSERKVLNKYYPPDFDPSKIPRMKMKVQNKVRLMAPMNMWCNICGNYIYKGLKFNARKETVEGEQFLGIRVYRFYIRCPRCAAECTFKTDPEHSDYVAEINLTRNLEPWRLALKQEEDAKKARELEEEENPMKRLENRTMDSRREMEVLEALEDIKDTNDRIGKVNTDALLAQYAKQAEQDKQRETLEDEEMVQRLLDKQRKLMAKANKRALGDDDDDDSDDDDDDGSSGKGNSGDGDDDDDNDFEEEDGLANVFTAQKKQQDAPQTALSSADAKHDSKRLKLAPSDAATSDKLISTGVTNLTSLVKKKPAPAPAQGKPSVAASSGLNLLGGYASDED